MMFAIFVWWLSGFLGVVFILLVCEDVEVPNEITVGDVISLLLGSCLGPVIWCFILLAFVCGKVQPKWESKVIFKRKK